MDTQTHEFRAFGLRHKTAGHLLLEFSNFGYMWTYVDTKKIVASHIIYSMLEIEPFTELLTVEKWRKFVHPHDLNKLIQAEEYVLITGESTSVEYRIITNRGKNLYLNQHMQLSRGVNDIKVMSILEDITEQKRGDVILDTMNEGFFELDDNFCFRRLNKHTEKFWNINRDNILGKKITDVFPDLDRTLFHKLIINAKSKKENLIDDVVSPVKNTWIRISVSPYNDGVIVVFYDINDEKRAEEELMRLKDELTKKATDRYYSLFNSIDQGFCIIEMIRDDNDKAVDYRFIEVNAAFEKQTGIKNTAGKTMREIEPQYEEHWFQIYDQVVRTRKPARFEHKAEFLMNGWYQVDAFPLEDIRETKVGLLFSNITERKKAEEQLRQFNATLEKQVADRTVELVKQNNILKQAEELAQGGSWEYYISTNKFIWSDGMHALFEIEKDTLPTPAIYLEWAIPEDKKIAEKIISAITKNFQSFEETIRIKPNDKIKTIKVKGAPFQNNKGETERVLGVDIDITKAQQLHEKITKLNSSLLARNKELNSLNSELNTFSSIAANNYSETLRHLYINLEMIVTNDARNLSNSGRANLRRAQGAIQKMKLTTDDLISYLRLQELGSRENNVDLTIIVEKVVDDFRNQAGHSLVEINCNQLPFITGYPSLLSLMFKHLMDNAVKFRKSDGGHIVNVTCEEFVDTREADHEVTGRDVKYNVISVSDNGIGFPQAESEQIFKMFYRIHDQTKYKGSGTGLALCKKIMEMHRGFITAEGTPGEGASFHCYFPAAGGVSPTKIPQ